MLMLNFLFCFTTDENTIPGIFYILLIEVYFMAYNFLFYKEKPFETLLLQKN